MSPVCSHEIKMMGDDFCLKMNQTPTLTNPFCREADVRLRIGSWTEVEPNQEDEMPIPNSGYEHATTIDKVVQSVLGTSIKS